MSQSAYTTVQSQESLATISSSNPNPYPNRSTEIAAVLEHLESMGYAPPASLVERTPASGFYSYGEEQQEEQQQDANVTRSPPFETQAGAPPFSSDEDQSFPCVTPIPEDDKIRDENISGALLHMSSVYHYAPPDSILHRASVSSDSNEHT
jgi:hypothetical protein